MRRSVRSTDPAGDEFDLIVDLASATNFSELHIVCPEQTFQPDNSSASPLVRFGFPSPKTKLASTRSDEIVWTQRKSTQSTGRADLWWSLQPSIKLPADPVGHGADR